jgi:uncharacterized repeat protein (TIGR03803 family)
MTALRHCKVVWAGFLLWAAMAVGLSAQTFTTLASFGDGSTIFSPLVQGRDGNLYGTANNGGTQANGSVFKITRSGVLTTLYNFCSQPTCSDGSAPAGGLVVGAEGNLYGTTSFGGTGDACAGGCGTVSKSRPPATSKSFIISMTPRALIPPLGWSWGGREFLWNDFQRRGQQLMFGRMRHSLQDVAYRRRNQPAQFRGE